MPARKTLGLSCQPEVIFAWLDSWFSQRGRPIHRKIIITLFLPIYPPTYLTLLFISISIFPPSPPTLFFFFFSFFLSSPSSSFPLASEKRNKLNKKRMNQ